MMHLTRLRFRLDHCRSAERNVRVEPFNSITSARAALDLLCSQLLISKNLYAGQNLCRMISDCVQEQLFFSREVLISSGSLETALFIQEIPSRGRKSR